MPLAGSMVNTCVVHDDVGGFQTCQALRVLFGYSQGDPDRLAGFHIGLPIRVLCLGGKAPFSGLDLRRVFRPSCHRLLGAVCRYIGLFFDALGYGSRVG